MERAQSCKTTLGPAVCMHGRENELMHHMHHTKSVPFIMKNVFHFRNMFSCLQK